MMELLECPDPWDVPIFTPTYHIDCLSATSLCVVHRIYIVIGIQEALIINENCHTVSHDKQRGLRRVNPPLCIM